MNSLRSRGLLSLIQEHNITSFSQLLSMCSETPKYLEHTLVELVSSGHIISDGDTIKQTLKPSYLPATDDVYSKVISLYHSDRIYDLIGWYMGLEMNITDEVILKRHVDKLYPLMRVVQQWNTEKIQSAYTILRETNPYKVISLEDIHQYLTQQSRGV